MNEVIRQYFDWDIARPYLGVLLRAFWVTIQISVLAEVLALVLGLLLALMRRARIRDVRLPPAAPGGRGRAAHGLRVGRNRGVRELSWL